MMRDKRNSVVVNYVQKNTGLPHHTMLCMVVS